MRGTGLARGGRRAAVAAAALLAVPPAAAAPRRALTPARFEEHRARCAGKDGWSDPAPPIRIFANVFDVGTCGIVVLLVAGDAGAILIDGATTDAAPSILANTERLGLRPRDVKLILSTHEHRDYAGGLAALRQRTGATMAATAAARPQLEAGSPAADDPQREADGPGFPGVKVDRVVRDGEVVRLGSLALTAHATPGHAPGGTSWSWRSCAAGTCHDVVFADSVTAVSSDAYRFSANPRYVADFERSLGTITGLRCDLIVTPHPSASRLYERLAGDRPLAARSACADYAAAGRAALDRRVADETTGVRR